MVTNKPTILKYIFVATIICSIVGFILANESKAFYLNQEIESSAEEKTYTFSIEANHDYLISFWALDEETSYEWASMESHVVILFEGEVLYEKDVSKSSSDDDGGVKRAQDGFEYKLTPEKSGDLTIIVQMSEGDEWSIEIYKDLPENLNILPAMFIIIAIIGVVGFLKAKNMPNN